MNYDSDYEVRLATLEAMGGDVTKHYDSVYEIDLEILKLTEQGGGSTSAIESVDVLPEASESKNKIYRLNEGEDVYVSELKSRTVLPPTNRLPDAEQVDKAYLFEIGDSIYYYKGSWRLSLNDGNIDAYGWINGNNEEWFLHFTQNNAENSNINTKSFMLSYDNESIITIDMENHIITYNGTLSDFEWDNTDSLENYDILAVIPATYNAPEDKQIGSATIEDTSAFVTCTYNGTPVRLSSYDGSEVVDGYEWRNDTDLLVSTKRASNIYFLIGGDDTYIGDTDFYFISTNNLEEYFTYDSTTNTYTLLEDSYVTSLSTYNMVSNNSLGDIYIPKLNASDAEQVGVAKMVDENGDYSYTYTGNQVEIHCDDGIVAAYQWIKDNTDGKGYGQSVFSFYSASNQYSENAIGQVSDSDLVWDSNENYWYSYDDVIPTTNNLKTPADYEGADLYNRNIVKYQRTEVTEVWNWEKVATQEYVDNLEINPIAEVESLPDAEENKDKFVRLQSDKKVYTSVVTSSELTNRLPDVQQIDKAYLYETSEDFYYYKGAFKLICNDGEINGYVWQNENYHLFTLDNAVDATLESSLYVIEDFEGWDVSGNTATTSVNSVADVEEETGTLEGWEIKAVIPATYNAPEANQIGNAYISYDGDNYIYTGEQGSFYNSDDEEVRGYIWKNGNLRLFTRNRKASEIYGDFNNMYYDFEVWDYDGMFDIITPDSIYIPQLNAPDSEQVDNAYLHDGGNHTFYYQGVVEGHFTDGVLPVYRWGDEGQNGFYTKYPANQQYRNDNEIEGCFEDSVELYWDSEQGGYYSSQYTIAQAESIISNSTIGDYIDIYSTVKYQRTAYNYEWKGVVTEDEITPISTELTTKANKVDFTIPVSVGVSGQTPDYSVLDNITVADGSYSLQYVLNVGGTDTITTSGILNVGVNGQMQTIYSLEAPCIKWCMRGKMGNVWMTLDAGELPSLWYNGAPDKNSYVYSASEVDNLISALDTRLTAIGG